MAEAKPAKLTEVQIIIRWAWFFVLYFFFILLIGSFGTIAEF
jgi:hypothetical protein